MSQSLNSKYNLYPYHTPYLSSYSCNTHTYSPYSQIKSNYHRNTPLSSYSTFSIPPHSQSLSTSYKHLKHAYLTREVRINDKEIESRMDKKTLELKHKLGVHEWNTLVKETKNDLSPLKAEYSKWSQLDLYSKGINVDNPITPKFHHYHHRYSSYDSTNAYNSLEKNDENVLKYMNKSVVELKNILPVENKMDKKRSSSVVLSRSRYIEENEVDSYLDDSVKKMKYEMSSEEWNKLIEETKKEIKRNEYMKDYTLTSDIIDKKKENIKSKIDINKSKIIRFYANKYKAEPENVYIDEIIQTWKGDYDKLEIKHGYIQWIFPLFESGLNFFCPSISVDEADYLRNDVLSMNRMDKLFEIMLDFYGMKLAFNTNTNKLIVVRRKNYDERYENMLIHQHNFLRITRILKSLQIMCKNDKLNAFLNHLIYEVYVSRRLSEAKYPCENYWLKLSNNYNDKHIENMSREKIIELINDDYHK